MTTPSESSNFNALFQSALEDYERETGIDLVKHPLAAQLDICDSVESVTQALQKQAQAFYEFRGSNNKVATLIQIAAQVLHRFSSTVVPGETVGLVCQNC